MGVYKLSVKTEIDLAEMYEYGISRFGLLQAQTYFNAMHDIFQLLANNATLGRDASEFIFKLRRFSFKAHTIFYLTTENGIFIVRVLSQRVDYESNF
jgi:toxin ParE1/3/4